MSDVVEAHAASHSDSRPGPPPLRIHHILIATVVTAVLLSDSEWLRQHDFRALSQYRRSVFGMEQAIGTGLATTTVLFGLWWRREGRAFFNQPGHWLLVYLALKVGMQGFTALSAVLQLHADDESYVAIERWAIVFLMLSVAITLWAGFRVADTSLWKTLFLLTGAFWLAIFTLRWFGANELIMATLMVGPLAMTLVLLGAAVADCRARRERDWAHWLGVVLALSMNAMGFVQIAWSWIVG